MFFFRQVGIALKPNTSVDTVTEYVDEADMILIMTVEPGLYNFWKKLILYRIIKEVYRPLSRAPSILFKIMQNQKIFIKIWY